MRYKKVVVVYENLKSPVLLKIREKAVKRALLIKRTPFLLEFYMNDSGLVYRFFIAWLPIFD